MRVPVLTICLLLLCAATAFGDSTPHWFQAKTEHFTVLTDAGDKQSRQVAGQLERMHAVFAKLLPGASADPGSRIVVLALKDRKGFQALEPAAYLEKNALDLAGYLMPAQDRSYILLRLDTAGDHPYSTVYHEYTHYMTRHAKTFPLWLNEGLAEFYQNADLGGKVVQFGEPSANDIYFLRQQKLLPLVTLFQVNRSSPYYHENGKGNIFYAESWALTHLLSMQDFGKKPNRLHEYAAFLSKGEDSVTAAQHAFGDLNRLQKDLDTYVNQARFNALSMPLENRTDEASFQVASIATPEADAVRAAVLVATGRREDAAALLTSVLRDAPQNAEAHESMGMLKLREGDMEAARKWYGEAVALHSDSYLAHYYFGTLSMREGDGPDDAAGESLRTAVKLNPRFAPALEALSQYDAMRNKDLDEALQMSVSAVQVEPANLEYRLNAAQVRVRRQEFESALAVLQAAATVAHTPEETALVHERRTEVERYQAAAQNAEQTRLEPAAASTAPSGVPGSGGVGAVHDKDGHILHPVAVAAGEHKYPTDPPAGPSAR